MEKKRGFIYAIIVSLQFLFLFLVVGILCIQILKIYGPNHPIFPHIYTSIYPKIDPDEQFISQNGRVLSPPLRPNEKGLKIPILMYHYISFSPWKNDIIRIGLSTPPYIFDEQLQLLTNNGYTTITLDDMTGVMAGRSMLPPKPVILTFDDGYEDFYLNAFPLLKKYHMKGIVFVITSLVGKPGYLTWPEIIEMAVTDNVMIGSHTINHLVLPVLNPDVLADELTTSKQILESHLGYPVEWFAYPYGDYNLKVVDAVRNAGYIGAVNTLPGNMQYESRLYYLTRFRAGTKLGGDLLKMME
jgi:peptidoglycan/xylan/chitin deacetylase (PgdA/CDA1 family)